jgi:MinD superfamily P-loop ATPase
MKSASANGELAIIEGSPGIGCPVIASLSGVDMVLIVAEPSLSGIRRYGTYNKYYSKIWNKNSSLYKQI